MQTVNADKVFQNYQELYYSQTSGVGHNVNGRYFVNETEEYVTVHGGIIVKVEKQGRKPMWFSPTMNIKFIKEKESDEFRFESMRNGYCRETGKIVAPKIPSIDSNEFDCLCLPVEEELSDSRFDPDDVAFSYSFDLVKEQVRVYLVDGKLYKLESLSDSNEFLYINTIESFLTKKRLQEAVNQFKKLSIPCYSDYEALYSNFTSGNIYAYTGEFFIESTKEIVKVERGRILSVISTDGGPNYTFSREDNVRYLAEDENDPNINDIRTYYNYFNRKTDSVSGRVYKNLESFCALVQSSKFSNNKIEDPVIFTLEEEQLQVQVDENGKFKQIRDLKTGGSVFYTANILATKDSLKTEVADILAKRKKTTEEIKEVDSWNDLYGKCTGGTGPSYTGTFLVKDVDELVTVKGGKVIKVVERTTGKDWIFSEDSNIRYVCKTKEDAVKLRKPSKYSYRVSSFFNIFIKEQYSYQILKFLNFEEAKQANAGELSFTMTDSSPILSALTFSFYLEEENIRVVIKNGKLISWFDHKTNSEHLVPENEQVLATVENVEKLLARLKTEKKVEVITTMKPSNNEETPNEDGHIVLDSWGIPQKYFKDFIGSLVLTQDNNCLVYLKNGHYHREDGPAYSYLDECKKGYAEWFLNGRRHNVYGPAITYTNNLGEPRYYINGKLYETKETWHRARIEWFVEQSSDDNHIRVKHWIDKHNVKDFTGSVIDDKGIICYYKEGKYHREGGLPCFIDPTRNYAEWLENDKLHNLNGPAKIGIEITQYGIEGKHYNKESGWVSAVKAYRAKHLVKDENLQTLSGCGTNNDVRVGDPMVETPPTNKDVLTEKGKEKKHMATSMNLKNEAIEAAYRVAVTQIRKMMREFLAKQMAQSAKGKKAQEGAYNAAMAFFSSEFGSAILGGVIGTLLPMVSDKLPEKYSVHVDRLAKEFRVDALTTAGNEVLELLKGSAGSLLEGTESILAALDAKTTSGMQVEEKSEETVEQVVETVSAGVTDSSRR